MRMIKCAFITVFLFLTLLVQPGFPEDNNQKTYTGIFGLWAWGNWDNALQIVKDNHFDIAVGVSGKTVLDKANALGIRCIVDYDVQKEMVTDDVKWQAYLKGLKAKILELRDHPAVFAWHIADEPDWNKIPVEKIKIITDLIRSLDKTRPIITVLTMPDQWNQYLPYFDIIAIDPYLKKRHDGSFEKPQKVREWILKMRSDLNKTNLRKPLWVVLGAFEERSKDPLLYKTPFKKPTPEEFNEMVKIALDEKVNGILIWTLSFKDFPRLKDWRLPEDDPLLWETVRSVPNVVRLSK